MPKMSPVNGIQPLSNLPFVSNIFKVRYVIFGGKRLGVSQKLNIFKLRLQVSRNLQMPECKNPEIVTHKQVLIVSQLNIVDNHYGAVWFM